MTNLKTITIPNFPPLLRRGVGGEVFKTISLCNIPVTPNKKGDCYHYSHHPNLIQCYHQILERSSDNAGQTILVILFFLITKTLQMYVFF